MSAETRPITPRSFARALADLPIQSLHLKVLELRNSLAHLVYSNEQLRVFAQTTPPDPDCAEAIAENEAVMARMEERIALVRAEVEGRGASWTEFQSKEEAEERAALGRALGRGLASGEVNGDLDDGDDSDTGRDRDDDAPPRTGTGANGASGVPRGERTHPAWTDGTFQTGSIRNGEVRMDPAPSTAAAASGGSTGGRLTDEQLRRAMEERVREMGLDDDGDEDGLHL